MSSSSARAVGPKTLQKLIAAISGINRTARHIIFCSSLEISFPVAKASFGPLRGLLLLRAWLLCPIPIKLIRINTRAASKCPSRQRESPHIRFPSSPDPAPVLSFKRGDAVGDAMIINYRIRGSISDLCRPCSQWSYCYRCPGRSHRGQIVARMPNFSGFAANVFWLLKQTGLLRLPRVGVHGTSPTAWFMRERARAAARRLLRLAASAS